MADYKKNYLKQVVFRIDFEEVGLTKINDYLKKVALYFSNTERKLGYESQFTLSFADGQPNQQQVNNPLTLWNLNNADETKKAELSSKWFWIEYSNYKNSDALLTDIKDIFEVFVEDFEVKVINRIGLRYSNVIVPPETSKPTDWAKYISTDLIAGINFANESSVALSRYMGQIVKHTDDHDLQFNYGMWNQDYPNQIARKEFILDYDCYSTLPMDTRDFVLSTIAKEFNVEIEMLFEKSITDSLRTIMKRT